MEENSVCDDVVAASPEGWVFEHYLGHRVGERRRVTMTVKRQGMLAIA